MFYLVCGYLRQDNSHFSNVTNVTKLISKHECAVLASQILVIES